jgi:hypothetical protein
MTAKRLLDEPGNDMIVIPFYRSARQPFLSGFMPIRWDNRLSFVADDFYRPEHYPPGSCIQ